MRILIEEYRYDVARVKDVLHGIDALENVEGQVSIHYVGYYYNILLNDCVFILPKVLLKDVGGQELAFGKYYPEDIVNLDPQKLEKNERDFLYKFAVWIYRAIIVYKHSRNSDPDIVYHTKIAEIGNGRRRLSNTYLDILLQLLQFNSDNQDFFFFILKNLHSGLNKINWTRTISRETAIVQDNSPVYLNPINKKRRINFDEELLIIFFSILNYISRTYGFTAEINCQYDLITGKRFDTYLKGYGKTRLLQIKYKYFSDKALELWCLCFAFFDESRQVSINTEKKEYLLVKNFYIVFEAIIDELVGENPLPDDMAKKQEDGKIVDHLYTAKSLIERENSKTYYIGDSKYYKMGHPLSNESIYKQYTYARNVIQWNLDIFNAGGTTKSGVKLRDDVTEGYNIIPNFFISAKMDENFDYSTDGIEKTDSEHNRHTKSHFKNRLFDRDTLLLFHYDVNFLFVLKLYARNHASQKATWKAKIRDKFREEIQGWLQDDYQFYAMHARPGVDAKEYFQTHFRDVLGKTFTPFADDNIYSLALDNKEKAENEHLLVELRKYFFVEECNLGEKPEKVLEQAMSSELPVIFYAQEEDLALLITIEGINFNNAIKKLEETGMVGIALKMDGAVLQLVEGFTKAKYLIIHNKSDRYKVYGFDGKGPKLIPGDQVEDMVMTKQGESLYLVYQVDLKFTFHLGEIDLSVVTKSGDSYSPQLWPVSKLVKKLETEDNQ